MSCEHEQSKVLNSVPGNVRPHVLRTRHRECSDCGARFTTYELRDKIVNEAIPYQSEHRRKQLEREERQVEEIRRVLGGN